MREFASEVARAIPLDAGYDSDETRVLPNELGFHGRVAHGGERAPIPSSQRWHVGRTRAWHNAFHRFARCYERRTTLIDAFFDLADTNTAQFERGKSESVSIHGSPHGPIPAATLVQE